MRPKANRSGFIEYARFISVRQQFSAQKSRLALPTAQFRLHFLAQSLLLSLSGDPFSFEPSAFARK